MQTEDNAPILRTLAVYDAARVEHEGKPVWVGVVDIVTFLLPADGQGPVPRIVRARNVLLNPGSLISDVVRPEWDGAVSWGPEAAACAVEAANPGLPMTPEGVRLAMMERTLNLELVSAQVVAPYGVGFEALAEGTEIKLPEHAQYLVPQAAMTLGGLWAMVRMLQERTAVMAELVALGAMGRGGWRVRRLGVPTNLPNGGRAEVLAHDALEVHRQTLVGAAWPYLIRTPGLRETVLTLGAPQ